MKNIIAISGSLRLGSSNHNILKFLGKLVPSNINYTIYDNLATIPPFDPGEDNDHVPNVVSELRIAIKNADAVIICTPEYAFGVPGQLKNALDWTVSSGSLVDKPLSLITASTSGQYAHAALLLILGALSANVIEPATLLIPFIRSKMVADGNITDADTAEKLKSAFTALIKSFN